MAPTSAFSRYFRNEPVAYLVTGPQSIAATDR